jgi:uncharacterized protein (DUF2235 family)
MRYYRPDDEVYFFGFSRGAYTARFLAEMIDHIGLLSQGNEELIRFAWKTFQKWQVRQERTEKDRIKKRQLLEYMCAFRETFSRPVRPIQFLGLFDTVNSVPKFENAFLQRTKFPYTAHSTARVIRHAVSLGERRAKFRQDLISENKVKRHRYRAREQKSKPSVPPAQAEKEEMERGRRATLQVPERFRDRSEVSGVQSLSEYRGSNRSFDRASSTASHESLCVIRRFYESEDEEEQDIQEVWFAGDHAVSDFGLGK